MVTGALGRDTSTQYHPDPGAISCSGLNDDSFTELEPASPFADD